MRALKNLNIEKSIELGKLVYTESWYDRLDAIFVYIFFCWGFILPFLIYFDPYRNNLKTGSEYSFLFIASFFCAYAIYRKAIEKRLIKIEGKYDAEKHKLIIDEYCKKLGLEKDRSSKNIIIYNKEMPYQFNTNYETSRIFLLKDQNIYFTMLKSNRLNSPVLFSQIFLKFEIKKLCQ